MTRAAALIGALLVVACGGGGGGGPATDAGCAGSSRSFARDAMVALLGRHPLGQAEVEAYAQLYDAAGGTPTEARALVARAMMASPEFIARWRVHFMDTLQIERVDEQRQGACFGRRLREPDQGSLAAWVRDTPAYDHNGDGGGAFTMLDLTDSSLALDDLSPLYRAQLLSSMAWPLAFANVPPLRKELTQRDYYGAKFDAVYLNRDLACLGCHNSEFSVTYSDEESTNRHWPLPGLLEQALYGESTGIDPQRAHAAFRFDGVVTTSIANQDDDSLEPWEWDVACGGFAPFFVPPDVAGIDGMLGSVTGTKTVYDVEAALHAGVDSLAERGLEIEEGLFVAPDQAMAYLTAASIVESVWREVIGSPLTIANHFPRNRAARDVLAELTTTFVRSHYSLHALLEAIVTGPYFDRLAPDAGCGEDPYTYPAIFDPWVTEEVDVAMRQNSAADAVYPLSARTASGAAERALGWEASPDVDVPETPCGGASCQRLVLNCEGGATECCGERDAWCGEGLTNPVEEEYQFEAGSGFFLSRARPGSRGMGFQARLIWERRFGGCARPAGQATDFVSELVARAVSSGATAREVVEALNDRLEGTPEIAVEESADVEAILGAGLDSPATAALEPGVRRLCGVGLATPHFLLAGVTDAAAHPIPRLTPPEASVASFCMEIASRDVSGATITCHQDELGVVR